MTSKEREQQRALEESVKFKKVIIPVLIGVGVVGYLIWMTFDLESFKTLSWNAKTGLFFGMAVLCYVLRHIAFSLRLKEVSDGEFSFMKSVELIFIWEFASTVSPTSFGGSAVAIFLLAQERIGGAKSVAMVIYTVLLDTLFFVISIPILVGVLGPGVVRPLSDPDLGGFVWTLWIVYGFTIFYGVLMLLGVLRPAFISKFIDWLSQRRLLARFKESMLTTAEEFKITSQELRTQSLGFYIRTLIYSFLAWILRFLAVVFVILGVVQGLDKDIFDFAILFGRTEMMHVITQFSPTPGGAGVAEGMFGGFYADYIPKGVATVIALIWRLITYYPYLIIGLIIIPNWLRKIVRRRRSTNEQLTAQ